ncbi:MAG: hypothetical protein ACTSRG_13420 [Candidatus Helarchaeota archaeon]
MSGNNFSDAAIQIKKMFEEVSNKLVQTNQYIENLSKNLTNVKNSIASNIASLNINIDRLTKTFETIFQLSEIEKARTTLLELTKTVQQELDKKNVSDMVSELIRGILKISKQSGMEQG